jgi:hypothetical protein
MKGMILKHKKSLTAHQNILGLTKCDLTTHQASLMSPSYKNLCFLKTLLLNSFNVVPETFLLLKHTFNIELNRGIAVIT